MNNHFLFFLLVSATRRVYFENLSWSVCISSASRDSFCCPSLSRLVTQGMWIYRNKDKTRLEEAELGSSTGRFRAKYVPGSDSWSGSDGQPVRMSAEEGNEK